MTKFCNTFKKPYLDTFLAHITYFWGNNVFPKKYGYQTQGPLTLCWVSEKNKEKSESQVNFRTEGKKDGQTFIHKTLPTTTGGPINSTLKILPFCYRSEHLQT